MVMAVVVVSEKVVVKGAEVLAKGVDTGVDGLDIRGFVGLGVALDVDSMVELIFEECSQLQHPTPRKKNRKKKM